MTSTADAPPFEEIQTDERYQLYHRFARARLLNTPPWVVLFIWFGLTQPPLWRQVLVLLLAATAFVVTIWDFSLFRRRAVRRLEQIPIPRFLFMPSFGILLVMLASGGIESPMVVVAPMLAFVAVYFAEPRLARGLVFGVQLPAIWLLAAVSVFELVPGLVPPVFGGGERAGHSAALMWATAGLASLAMLGSYRMGKIMRDSYETVLERAATERDRAREMHAEQSQALTSLSGEIAHELKNPLASVKGLAALIALDLDGEPAEQMSVLRQEVDRMQGVLEEFLNFSRPLVPLTQEPQDLAAVAREVAELHQGLASEREITIGVQARGRVEVLCDDRKIRQILINLIQNALEASPRGGLVAIDVSEPEPRSVSVRVLDRGPGLSPELSGRFFEPGITDKPKGSGLGLTVARSLARQHGGDLTLSDRDGGGCVAELRLLRGAGSEEAGS